MRSVTLYCKSWSRAFKKPVDPLPSDRVGSKHNARQMYTAVIGAPERPYCFVEFAGSVVSVSFLDSDLREYLCYTFTEVQPEVLFLQRATHRLYFANSERVRESSTYLFKATGTLSVMQQSHDRHDVNTAEHSADVEVNYERRPQFGDYASLIRKER